MKNMARMPMPLAVGRIGPVEQNAWQLAVETLREIFDENAYSRFLARHHLENTRSAYSQFLRQEERDRVRRPKCC